MLATFTYLCLQWFRRLFRVAMLACLTSGCTGPALRADAIAATAAFVRTTVQGMPFEHVAYTAHNAEPTAPLWVYIEGDGVPWINETIPSRDPTPRTLVALALMAKGPRPAVYLGRPCYFGTSEQAPCEPVWWTHRRFGPEVVGSMVAALRQLIAERDWTGRVVNLVGFSGGGTLATLMAARMADVCALITIASPLDIDEWAQSHGYSPLVGSENPALLPPLADRVRQLHLRGEHDEVVLPGNGSEFRRRNPAARFQVIADVEHGPAWIAIWENLLRAKQDPAIAACS